MWRTFLRANLALRAIRHISVFVIRAANQLGQYGEERKSLCSSLGRSPRMQYHALSLACEASLQVDIVAYGGSIPHEVVLKHPSIHIHTMAQPRFINLLPKILYPVKLYCSRHLFSLQCFSGFCSSKYQHLTFSWFRKKISHFQLLRWSEFARTEDHLICKCHACLVCPVRYPRAHHCFDQKAPSMISINMENHLCFDPGTTHMPLTTNIQEHCEKLDLIIFLSEMCVKISSQDVKRFGFDKVKEFRVSDYVFENMFNSFKVFEPDELLNQKRFQHDNGINCGFVLSFDQFLKHSKENSFNLSFYRHALITGQLFASTCALNEFMVKTLLEQKSPRVETDFCDYVLKLKYVLHVLGKETLISYLNKYMSCTYDPGILFSVLSAQDKQVIFSSREFRPPEKLEMANLLSDEPTTNSIMPKNTFVSWLGYLRVNKSLFRWTCASYQATFRNPPFGGLVSQIKH
ncbi:hypothetical protein F2Q69_00059564 [Brassica cretica]|uniref:Uncharacterized protein n=1 Tax=Brassica cretica TaxID=69181 RepID=A0A8S9RCK9_BRACR|nr:hypothetical protein F2Q69_00059564 [Brassica cretica]